MELPKNESTFEVAVVGDTTYKKYDGQFTVRCVLTMGQKHGMELEKTRLMGNHASPTEDLKGLAIIFANLRAKITDAPEWWKQSVGGATISDENVLIELFDQVEKAEKEWRQKVRDLANPPSAESQSPSQ